MKFAVVGTDHLHVVELVSGLRDAGAELVAIMPTEDRIGAWLATQYESARTVDTIDDAFADVDVVVTAAIPGDRAEIGIAAMHAGKDVLADKPGATSAEQLAALRAAHAETGKQYLVLFSERLTNAAMVRAYDLVQAGRIGLVVHTVGLGPHTLNLTRRPEWFFDPARYGGILVDIGSHQVDQFLAFTGSRTAEVLTSTVRAHPEHPGVQVLGEVLLATDGATGYARVDYYTPSGPRARVGRRALHRRGHRGLPRSAPHRPDRARRRRREAGDHRLHGGARRLGRPLPRRHPRDPGPRLRGHRDLPGRAVLGPPRAESRVSQLTAAAERAR